MTDDQLELRLREWYRLEIADDEPAPPSLRSGLASIPQVSPLPRRGFARRRGFTLLAAAALVGVLAGGALLTGSGLVMLPSVPPSVVPPTAPASANPSAELPSAAPTALPAYAGLIAYVQFGPLGPTPANAQPGRAASSIRIPPIQDARASGSRIRMGPERTSCSRITPATRRCWNGHRTEVACFSRMTRGFGLSTRRAPSCSRSCSKICARLRAPTPSSGATSSRRTISTRSPPASVMGSDPAPRQARQRSMSLRPLPPPCPMSRSS